MFSVSIIWSMPFILCHYFNYHLYRIKDKEKVKLASSRIKFSSIKNENDNPSGFFVGYPTKGKFIYIPTYFGFFIDKEKGFEIFIFTHKDTFKELTTSELNLLEKDSIVMYERTGNYFWLEYTKRDLIVDHFIPKENQSFIIDDIVNYYESNKNCVSFISGAPGSGKSMLGILLAKKLKGSIVRTFNPTEPGDSLSSLYSEVSPTVDKPLIIVLDEADIIIRKIHENNITPHKHIPILVCDKMSWNRFLDDICLGLFPNMILVLTSNISYGALEESFDPSYIREGRVNLKFIL